MQFPISERLKKSHDILSRNMMFVRNFCFVALVLMLMIISEHRAPVATAANDDTTAPDITAVEVIDVTETSIKVKWITDEDADSLINYGLKEDYGIVRVPVTDKKQHEIMLEGLDPGRKYHFRVVSADEAGNQGISADYQVQTKGEPNSTGSGQSSSQDTTSTSQTTTQQAIEAIKQESSPQRLQEILNEVVKAINGITEDLAIIGPPTVVAESTTARVLWVTDRESDSSVDFSSGTDYTEGRYRYSQVATGAPTKDHEVELIGLEPFTEYHFKVKSKDSYGIEGVSRDYTFKTKATLPQIRNLRVLKVEENAATLAWDTTVPAKALVEYQNLTTGEQSSVGRPTLAATHQLRIDGLSLGVRYLAYVIAESAGGDRIKSNPITFVTAKDNAPPIISNVTNESTLFPGSEARIQTIISWVTDEPTYCVLSYREGLSLGTEPTVLEPEDKSFTERHVEVITEFAPATVYKFSLVCNDESKNTATSEDFVLFTPAKEKNIIDLIIENFQGTFGWVKNIGK